MQGMSSIAVLMTSHNRSELTLRCLSSLFRQTSINELSIEVYLVDDGSTDGTGYLVKKQFPQVNVIRGNGELYWCGGMRKAWKEALKKKFGFYLWLNDDVDLFEVALNDVFESYLLVSKDTDRNVIIGGSFIDQDTGAGFYGGYIYQSPMLFVPPARYPEKVDVCSGNLILVPSEVVKEIGILDKRFSHSMGDFDYMRRARKKNINVYISKGYQGYCRANDEGTPWRNHKLPFRERWNLLHNPKGPPPIEYFKYKFRYNKFVAPFSFIRMYLRLLFPRLF